MSKRYKNGSHYENHRKAAEINNLPGHTHEKAAASRGDQEHFTSHDRARSSNVRSGDNQGLLDVAEADSQSVAELLEEGQTFEAEVVRGVENAPDAGLAEVTTREVLEDDVPPEYRDRD